MKRSMLTGVLDRGVRGFLLSISHKNKNILIINEFPKSGGSWVGQILSDYLNISFPRNKIPLSSKVLLHGHYLPGCFKGKPIIMYRDPRDVMVSWYYHCYFVNDKYNERLVGRMKKRYPFEDYDNIKSNLPKFIEQQFRDGYPLKFSWSFFYKTWLDSPHYRIDYEEMISDPFSEMSNLLTQMSIEIDTKKLLVIIDKYSFLNQTGRSPGQENSKSFIRNGTSGSWVKSFDKTALEVLDKNVSEIQSLIKKK